MFYTRNKRNKIIKLNYITIKKIYSRTELTIDALSLLTLIITLIVSGIYPFANLLSRLQTITKTIENKA